jgi:hypothetical protein
VDVKLPSGVIYQKKDNVPEAKIPFKMSVLDQNNKIVRYDDYLSDELSEYEQTKKFPKLSDARQRNKIEQLNT